MTTIRFFAQGTPKGQPRPRAFSRGGKASVYDPATAEGWKGCVAMAARPSLSPEPLAGPLVVVFEFIMPRASDHYRTGKHAGTLKDSAPTHHTHTPDIDNLAKAVMDCLTTIRLWHDDAQVVNGSIAKRYQRNSDEAPGVHVTIEQAN